jgi:uncharacterized membrane protein YcjF (UPF0283 family)
MATHPLAVRWYVIGYAVMIISVTLIIALAVGAFDSWVVFEIFPRTKWLSYGYAGLMLITGLLTVRYVYNTNALANAYCATYRDGQGCEWFKKDSEES